MLTKISEIINIGDKVGDFTCIEIIEDDFRLTFTIEHPLYGKWSTWIWLTVELINEKEIAFDYLNHELNYLYNKSIETREKTHGIAIT